MLMSKSSIPDRDSLIEVYFFVPSWTYISVQLTAIYRISGSEDLFYLLLPHNFFCAKDGKKNVLLSLTKVYESTVLGRDTVFLWLNSFSPVIPASTSSS